MALYLAPPPASRRPVPNSKLFEPNHQDIDLVAAFHNYATTQPVVLEAKMETGWTNAQMDTKARWLRRIFRVRPGTGLAKPHFVLLSPRHPERLQTDNWPPWMKPDGKLVWMKLPRPEDLRKVLIAPIASLNSSVAAASRPGVSLPSLAGVPINTKNCAVPGEQLCLQRAPRVHLAGSTKRGCQRSRRQCPIGSASSVEASSRPRQPTVRVA